MASAERGSLWPSKRQPWVAREGTTSLWIGPRDRATADLLEAEAGGIDRRPLAPCPRREPGAIRRRRWPTPATTSVALGSADLGDDSGSDQWRCGELLDLERLEFPLTRIPGRSAACGRTHEAPRGGRAIGSGPATGSSSGVARSEQMPGEQTRANKQVRSVAAQTCASVPAGPGTEPDLHQAGFVVTLPEMSAARCQYRAEQSGSE